MRFSRSIFAVTLAACALIATVPNAFAQPKHPAGNAATTEAKRLFDQGAEEYSKGNYEQSIEQWQMAYDLSKKPLIYESIANAYERLGQAKKAREYLAKWREVAPKDEWDLLDTRLRNLDARITREETLEAQRKADEEKAKAAQDAQEKKDREAGIPPVMGPKPPPKRPIAGYVLTAGGVAALAVGITLDIIASSRRPDVSTACQATGGQTICRTSAKGGIESSNSLATVGDVVWIVGGLAAAAGVTVIILTTPKSEPTASPLTPKAQASLVPWVLPGGAGIGFVGRM